MPVKRYISSSVAKWTGLKDVKVGRKGPSIVADRAVNKI